MKNLCDQIKDLRLSCKLSLNQMAEYLELTNDCVDWMENNEGYITTSNLESIQDLCYHEYDLSSFNAFDLKVIASINRIAKNSELMSKLLKGKTDE